MIKNISQSIYLHQERKLSSTKCLWTCYIQVMEIKYYSDRGIRVIDIKDYLNLFKLYSK